MGFPFEGPSQPGKGGHKTPPAGYQKNDTGQPGGTPTGKTPKPGNEKYKGTHVGGIGGSGTTRNTPKPMRGGSKPAC